MKAKVYVTKVRDFKNIFIAVIMNSILNSLIHEKGFFQKKIGIAFSHRYLFAYSSGPIWASAFKT